MSVFMNLEEKMKQFSILLVSFILATGTSFAEGGLAARLHHSLTSSFHSHSTFSSSPTKGLSTVYGGADIAKPSFITPETLLG